ncbi:MAG TPA: general stress protein [Capsulimonadaceae bacterium]|jgi:hypothetical protein
MTSTATAPLAKEPSPTPTLLLQPVVATYTQHADAELAVRRLAAGGIPTNHISIIGRNFETREDVQGFYQPGDAAVDGAAAGAWMGGMFGLFMGAMGFFVVPVVGAMMVMGPLSGLIAGAVGGAGVGALLNGLVAAGVPHNQAIKYQDRIQAGEFLILVHGTADETTTAHELLENTNPSYLRTHGLSTEGFASNFMGGVLL